MASLGINSKLYYNSATFGTPTWVELSNVRELNADSSWDEGDASTRASPVKMFEPTQLNLELSGQMQADGSVNYLLMQTKYYARTLVDVMCLDGASDDTGSEGYRFEGKIFGWTEDQGPGVVNYRAFTIKPCASANPPKSVVVTAGAPVYTSIT
jgi:hypothetical protein